MTKLITIVLASMVGGLLLFSHSVNASARDIATNRNSVCSLICDKCAIAKVDGQDMDHCNCGPCGEANRAAIYCVDDSEEKQKKIKQLTDKETQRYTQEKEQRAKDKKKAEEAAAKKKAEEEAAKKKADEEEAKKKADEEAAKKKADEEKNANLEKAEKADVASLAGHMVSMLRGLFYGSSVTKEQPESAKTTDDVTVKASGSSTEETKEENKLENAAPATEASPKESTDSAEEKKEVPEEKQPESAAPATDASSNESTDSAEEKKPEQGPESAKPADDVAPKDSADSSATTEEKGKNESNEVTDAPSSPVEDEEAKFDKDFQIQLAAKIQEIEANEIQCSSNEVLLKEYEKPESVRDIGLGGCVLTKELFSSNVVPRCSAPGYLLKPRCRVCSSVIRV